MDVIDKFKDLLIDNGITIEDILSQSQQEAYSAFIKKKSFCIIGCGGTGKSHLIKHCYKTRDSNTTMYITATTGIASFSIGGITINAFSGIRTNTNPIDYTIRHLHNDTRQRIIYTDILVIDEISMMSADLFENLDILFRRVRKKNVLFGGMQLILVGDFLQLEPVFPKYYNSKTPRDCRMLFESELFRKHFSKKLKNIFIFDYIYRQENDKIFAEILNRLRIGKSTKQDFEKLKTRIVNKNLTVPEHAVTLVSSNKRAKEINTMCNDRLKSEGVTFEARYDSLGNNKELIKTLETDLRKQIEQREFNIVTLKKGSRVMLVQNINVLNGLVNGATGVVVSIERHPLCVKVLFDSTHLISKITPTKFKLEMNDNVAIATQIPLILAYALTIHKSQSLTLDCAYIETSDVFCNHQIYVALSRLKTLDSLYLKSLNEHKIKVNKKVIEFMNEIN